MKFVSLLTVLLAGMALSAGTQTLPAIKEVKTYIHPMLNEVPPGLVYTTKTPEGKGIRFYITRYNNNSRIARLETSVAADDKQPLKLLGYKAFTYNSRGDMLSTTEKSESYGTQTTYYRYSEDGNLWRYDGVSSSTSYKYKKDSKGRMINSFKSMAFNNVKKIISTTQNFKYDDRNRIIFSDEVNGKGSKNKGEGYRSTAYVYDDITGLTSSIQTYNQHGAGIARETATYNANGTLKKIENWSQFFGGTSTMTYAWNDAGLVIEIVHSIGPVKTTFTYDDQNRMLSKIERIYDKAAGKWESDKQSTFLWETTTNTLGKSEIIGKEIRSIPGERNLLVYHILNPEG